MFQICHWALHWHLLCGLSRLALKMIFKKLYFAVKATKYDILNILPSQIVPSEFLTKFIFCCLFLFLTLDLKFSKFSSSAVYVAETATPKMRGLLGACVQLMVDLLFVFLLSKQQE